MKVFFLICVLCFCLPLGSCSQDIVSTINENKPQTEEVNTPIVLSKEIEENLQSEEENNIETNSIPDYLNFERDGNNFTLENILAQNESYTRYQISYTSEGFTISGIMNIPSGKWEYPLIILNHGYIDPVVYTLGRWLKREQDFLARAGYAVLHTDYRNHAFSDTDESLNGTGAVLRSKKYGADAINAVLAVQNAKSSWMQELEYIHADTVWMLWHSMGGGVTMYGLVAAPDIIDAAVLYAPVHSQEWYNYKRWREDSLSNNEKEILENLYGDLEKPESFKDISPETYFSYIQAPVQMYFGTLDESCPVEWGDDIQNAFYQEDKDLEYIIYEGEKHEFIPRFSDFMNGVDRFFEENFLWEK